MAIWTGYKNRKTPLHDSDLDIAKQIYGVTSSYLNQMYGAGSEDFDMPSGVYNNGSYVFLTGSSTSNVYTGSLGTSSSSSSLDSTKAVTHQVHKIVNSTALMLQQIHRHRPLMALNIQIQTLLQQKNKK